MCVCVLTTANFSYMSIFLHIRSHTHTHIHAHGKKLVEVLLGQGTKMFLAYAVAHLWPPGAGFSNFWLLDLNDERCHKGPCMLASSHTHTRIHVSCLCCAKRCRGSIHQLTLDFISFCRRCLLEMRFPFWVYCHCLTLAFAFGSLFSLFLCLLCTLFLFLRTS